MEEQYLNITYSLLYNPLLTSDEKLILAEIVSLHSLPKGCFASDNHFAKIINKSRQTANGIAKKFESRGLIIIENIIGKGKKTSLSNNFWELIKMPVKFDDTSNEVQSLSPVEMSDTTCQDTLQVDVETEDTTCRDIDTINTSTITDILIQEELHYTGETMANLDIKVDVELEYINAVEKLLNIDPENVKNQFLYEYYLSLAGLETKFGLDFIFNGNIFKSNNELYKEYGFGNFKDIREDLMFVKDNLNRFIRDSRYI